MQEFSSTTNYYLRTVFFLAIPAAIGTYVLAVPIVELLFQRGKFTPQDTVMTSMVLQIYAFSIFTASGVRVLAPSFYAIKNTVYPMICSLVALGEFQFVTLFVALARFSFLGLVMWGCLAFYPMIRDFCGSDLIGRSIALFGTITVSAGVCMGGAVILRFQEAQHVMDRLRRRLRR